VSKINYERSALGIQNIEKNPIMYAVRTQLGSNNENEQYLSIVQTLSAQLKLRHDFGHCERGAFTM